MIRLNIPPDLQTHFAGLREIEVSGTTVGSALTEADRLHPGLREHLTVNGKLKPGLMISVNGRFATKGLREPTPDGSEVHFLPGIGGG